MKHLKIALIMLLIPFLGFSEEIPFYKGSIAGVKTKAKQEGKLYILDFYATWCLPCKFMEENTYSDPRVLELFHSSYIPVKVDIDDFDGFALKNQFNVSVLPTIMIFDANGVLLERIEETMAPSQFIKLLKRFENKKGVPSSSSFSAPTTATYDNGVDVIGVPGSSIGSTTNDFAVEAPMVTEAPRLEEPSLPSSYEAPTYNKPETANTYGDLTPVNDNLYEFTSRRPVYQGYGIQVGIYAQYANVLREVERFQNMFQEPVLVNISQLNGRTVYRLLLGNFKSEGEAQTYKQSVQDGGLSDAFVKDLKTLK